MESADIRFRIIMLDAQKEGIEAELRKLREIPCPICQFSSRRGTIEKKGPEEGTVHYDKCEACNGTGFASGEYPSRY